MSPPVESSTVAKLKQQPQYIWRTTEGGIGQFHPGSIDDDQRIRVNAYNTGPIDIGGDLEVNLDYDNDQVMTLRDKPTASGAPSDANPDFTLTRNSSQLITKLSSTQWGLERTLTRNAAGYITGIGAWSTP